MLTNAAMAAGAEWKERERLVESIRHRQVKKDIQKQRQHAGKQKLGHTKADPCVVLARVEELRRQGLRGKMIEPIIRDEFNVSYRTLRNYQNNLRQ